ncbi:hypothetical protein AC244_17730 [Ensifer adhaerens]|uniref:Uncharacterized protein n=1 Tax=Ensifer adhaerens TaxID=106592 RepID=A0A0L8BS13_ENSAD|nr:hypothetical protein AC244_17730 [Ensifer adhaerens]
MSSEPTQDSRFNGGIPIECAQTKTYFKPNDKLAGLTGFGVSAAILRRFEDGLKIGVIARACEVKGTILSTGDASSLHAKWRAKALPVREG